MKKIRRYEVSYDDIRELLIKHYGFDFEGCYDPVLIKADTVVYLEAQEYYEPVKLEVEQDFSCNKPLDTAYDRPFTQLDIDPDWQG